MDTHCLPGAGTPWPSPPSTCRPHLPPHLVTQPQHHLTFLTHPTSSHLPHPPHLTSSTSSHLHIHLTSPHLPRCTSTPTLPHLHTHLISAPHPPHLTSPSSPTSPSSSTWLLTPLISPSSPTSPRLHISFHLTSTLRSPHLHTFLTYTHRPHLNSLYISNRAILHLTLT